MSSIAVMLVAGGPIRPEKRTPRSLDAATAAVRVEPGARVVLATAGYAYPENVLAPGGRGANASDRDRVGEAARVPGRALQSQL